MLHHGLFHQLEAPAGVELIDLPPERDGVRLISCQGVGCHQVIRDTGAHVPV